MDGKETKTSVLMLPWLAHGHISPFLELAKRLADRNFNSYICSTPILLDSIKKKITQKYVNSIKLVPFNIPPSPELPPHFHTTNGLPPHLMPNLKNEYEKASPQFSTILSQLHPDLVIYDFIQHWAAEMAFSQSIPAVQFATVAAFILSWHRTHNTQAEFPFPEIYLRGYEIQRFRAISESLGVEMEKDVKRCVAALKSSYDILLVKSCREIEGNYIDFYSNTGDKKLVPVGQLVDEDCSTDEDHEEQPEIIQWLETKQEKSVVFVSFGTEYFLTKEERYEIAKGLELSGVDFIWVIRFPLRGKISILEAVPEGFLERIKEKGMVVEGWAPQVRILKHKSIGGFVSHCGWSSVMESMKFGVPMVAMPMHIDQPLNARLVEAVGVGVEAVRDEEGKLMSMEIAKAIRKAVVEESGEEVRKKAKELSQKLKMKKDEEIDILVEEIGELRKKFSKQLLSVN